MTYLARRKMRSARITKRRSYADLIETTHNKPAPDPITPLPPTQTTPDPDETAAVIHLRPDDDIITQPLPEKPIPVAKVAAPLVSFPVMGNLGALLPPRHISPERQPKKCGGGAK